MELLKTILGTITGMALFEFVKYIFKNNSNQTNSGRNYKKTSQNIKKNNNY